MSAILSWAYYLGGTNSSPFRKGLIPLRPAVLGLSISIIPVFRTCFVSARETPVNAPHHVPARLRWIQGLTSIINARFCDATGMSGEAESFHSGARIKTAS